jgi:CDP-6-deoxy-D-xylo-4-hexulose-3-dehydrase
MGETITFSDRLKMATFALTAKKFTNGEKVKKFESRWNDWLGSRNSIYVSSGSTANFLLVAAMKEKYGLKNGDKVLLPACTWVTNVAPIIQLGLEPIFCDINLQNFSFNIPDVKLIAAKHKIKAIFVTHLLGFSGENEKLREIFPDALIIDDVCESHGCLDTKGRKVGTDSLGATFSFYFGHHMSTIEGGMVSSNDDELYDLMRMKRSHGMAKESINFGYYAAKNEQIYGKGTSTKTASNFCAAKRQLGGTGFAVKACY